MKKCMLILGMLLFQGVVSGSLSRHPSEEWDHVTPSSVRLAENPDPTMTSKPDPQQTVTDLTDTLSITLADAFRKADNQRTRRLEKLTDECAQFQGLMAADLRTAQDRIAELEEANAHLLSELNKFEKTEQANVRTIGNRDERIAELEKRNRELENLCTKL